MEELKHTLNVLIKIADRHEKQLQQFSNVVETMTETFKTFQEANETIRHQLTELERRCVDNTQFAEAGFKKLNSDILDHESRLEAMEDYLELKDE